MALHPVIMAGGSGTRFWPLSRRKRPKQFLPLTSRKALLVETVDRLKGLARPENVWVVCGRVHAPSVRKLLPKLPRGNVLVEPEARNTAPCVGLAAAVIAKKDPEAILAVLPADHHVADPAGFRAALARAAEIAATGALVTIGIRPAHPETGFGYIQQGPELSGGALPVYAVQRFVEKPDLATAKGYLADGRYLWNAGIFVFKASRILGELAAHLPETRAPLEAIGKAAGKRTFEGTLKKQFAKMPKISIDYGVMERAGNIAVVPAEFGWSDVGSFSALPEVRARDAQGNVSEGEAVLVDVADSVVLAGKRPVAVLGVSGLVVVDAGDAILVCPKERAQDVRRLVEALERKKRTAVL
ncbi:MAG: mannose-1-phosphate guanylyltransferase [Myxococcales bacterium]